jgi:hypothetical protein
MAVQLRTRWPEWTVLALYATLVACAIPFHEPWADEAQAWQLARSLSLPALFHTYIRYEGTPGLWYLLLWILIRVHLSYTALHWLCGAIAFGANALLILKSPFPRYLKLTLPFTYFLLFQYAVIARSYVLVPLLLYVIAVCWKKNPLTVALLLGLLANVSLHAAAISAGLAAVYLIDQIRLGSFRKPRHLRPLLLGAGLLLCFWVAALSTAWPPQDLLGHIAQVRNNSRPGLGSAILSLVWPICPDWIGSLAFWLVIPFWFGSRRRLFYLIPVLLFAAFSAAIPFAWWHVGLLLPLLLTLLWLTWPAQQARISRADAIGGICLLAVAIPQILWSAYAIDFDHSNAYSPDLATARFLQPLVRQGAVIAVTSLDDPGCDACRSVGILPYFDHNIFVNQPDPFWSWSSSNPTEERFLQILPSHPTVVVVEARTSHPETPISLHAPQIDRLTQSGYSLTHMFCGAWPVGFHLAERSCHLIFQRADSSPSRDPHHTPRFTNPE